MADGRWKMQDGREAEKKAAVRGEAGWVVKRKSLSVSEVNSRGGRVLRFLQTVDPGRHPFLR